jgi:hypothetical protein
MAIFGTPAAHDDDAQRAARDALAIQAAILEVSARVGRPVSPTPLRSIVFATTAGGSGYWLHCRASRRCSTDYAGKFDCFRIPLLETHNSATLPVWTRSHLVDLRVQWRGPPWGGGSCHRTR